MHKAVKQFIQGIRTLHPEFFTKVKVLDCGSLDINGNNRQFFSDSVYTGIDIVDGRNVDQVTRVHKFNATGLYDVVISTEMLEHDNCLPQSLHAMFNMLRQGGLMILTAAGFGREEHGTHEHHPGDSPLTHDYYLNVDSRQIIGNLPLHLFSSWSMSFVGTDIRFYGFKRHD